MPNLEHESLPSPEKLAPAAAREAKGFSALTETDADRMEAESMRMFAALEPRMTAPLREAVRAKIAGERRRLLALVDYDRRVREAAREFIHVLDPHYFTQRPLDTEQ